MDKMDEEILRTHKRMSDGFMNDLFEIMLLCYENNSEEVDLSFQIKGKKVNVKINFEVEDADSNWNIRRRQKRVGWFYRPTTPLHLAKVLWLVFLKPHWKLNIQNLKRVVNCQTQKSSIAITVNVNGWLIKVNMKAVLR